MVMMYTLLLLFYFLLRQIDFRSFVITATFPSFSSAYVQVLQQKKAEGGGHPRPKEEEHGANLGTCGHKKRAVCR